MLVATRADTRQCVYTRVHEQPTLSYERAHARKNMYTCTTICLVASQRKRSGCLPLAFRHTPTHIHRANPLVPFTKHVPNLEQRRHTNPTDFQADAPGTDSFLCFHTAVAVSLPRERTQVD